MQSSEPCYRLSNTLDSTQKLKTYTNGTLQVILHTEHMIMTNICTEHCNLVAGTITLYMVGPMFKPQHYSKAFQGFFCSFTQPESEAVQSPPSSVKTKNVRSNPSTSLDTFRACWLIKHSTNHTFYLNTTCQFHNEATPRFIHQNCQCSWNIQSFCYTTKTS
jgi:hypothetical protein